MSAKTFKFKIRSYCWPFVPFSQILGAVFRLDLNLVLPLPPIPPLATKYNFSSIISANKSLLTSFIIIVPIGTFIIKSFPFAP